MATLVSRITKGGPLSLEEYDANNEVLNAELIAATGKTTVFPYYHFHGFAGNQVADESVFSDISGINHASRGANLSVSQLWTTNPGYASTIDPASGATDSVLRIPPINFDYLAGEKMLVWWLGKCLAEGSSSHFMGDGNSTSVRGWTVWVPTSQKLQIVLHGATSGFSGSSAASVFDGTLHSFGFVIDGQNKKYCFWIDEALDINFGAGYATFGSGADFDTKTTATVNIGAASPAPGGTIGIATATRALVILRFPAASTVPAVADVTNVFKQLRANPGKLITTSAFS